MHHVRGPARWRRAAWGTGLVTLVALGYASAGCGSILERTQLSERLIRIEQRDSPPVGAPNINTEWRFEGAELRVAVDQWRQCKRDTTKVVHRTETIQRKLETESSLTFIIAGLVVGGSGGAVAAFPEVIDPAQPEAMRIVGVVGASIGALMILNAVGNELRAIDGEEDLGEHTVPIGTSQTFSCAETRGEGLGAILRLPGGRAIAGRLQDGEFRFPIASVAALAEGRVHSATLEVGDRKEELLLVTSPDYLNALKRLGGARP